MARIRTIKPEFFTSEDIVSLSPFARLLYIALWCEADKSGRMLWKPRTFKMRYLPADTVEIEPLCEELVDAGLVALYGEGYAFIPQFAKHQHVNPRESESTLPEPDASTTRHPRVMHAPSTRDDASSTREPRDSDAQGGREGKGRERKNTPLPPEGEVLPGFADFWRAWPKSDRKQAKGKCLEAWKKAEAEPLAALIVAHVERLKASDDWKREGGRYIPAPIVYLHQRRWEGTEGAQATAAGPNGAGDDWWRTAGFDNRWEAENDGCWPHTAHLFHDGQRRGPAS